MSSYRGPLNELSRSERLDLETAGTACRRCGGLGYVVHRGSGNPMACDPCGCDEPEEDEDNG